MARRTVEHIKARHHADDAPDKMQATFERPTEYAEDDEMRRRGLEMLHAIHTMEDKYSLPEDTIARFRNGDFGGPMEYPPQAMFTGLEEL